MSPRIYLNLFSVKKLRNSLLLQTWTDAWALSLSGTHAYPFTFHQSSFLFHISWSADFCPWACLIFKLLLEIYLDGKELMAEWEGTTLPLTLELWLLNYCVDIYSCRKLAYLPFILNKHSSYENFISWGLPRELQHIMRCFQEWIHHPTEQSTRQPWNLLLLLSHSFNIVLPQL